MVGLGRLELPTLRLSGVRSNHLSYRPIVKARGRQPVARHQGRTDLPEGRTRQRQHGGAGRDRTGDLLNANQALSQLSYSPFELFRNRSKTRRP